MEIILKHTKDSYSRTTKLKSRQGWQGSQFLTEWPHLGGFQKDICTSTNVHGLIHAYTTIDTSCENPHPSRKRLLRENRGKVFDYFPDWTSDVG